jgi:hypothetical protein
MINEILQCDFCSMPGPVWRYPARSFVAYCAPNVAGESVGDWAACDLCHVLIEAGDRRGLAQRSLDELILSTRKDRAAAVREDLAGFTVILCASGGMAVRITGTLRESEHGREMSPMIRRWNSL